MTAPFTTTHDGVLLACSGLALPRGDLKPLGPKAWARLWERLQAAKLDVGDLPELDRGDFRARLGYSERDADELARLFARRGQVALEMERLGRLGIWVLTVLDDDYPARLRVRLGDAAPPVLFGMGDRANLTGDGVAVVGSRDADPDSLDFAESVGRWAADRGWSTVSGAARGVDVTAMRGAFEAGGVVVGIPADGLEHRLRDASIRMAVTEGQAVLVSPYRPDAPFSVGSAMGRNKLIYALSTVAVVVSSSSGSGGTWAGAVEALKSRWVPVYVRDSTGERNGNAELIARGGRALAGVGALDHIDLANEAKPGAAVPEPAQSTLFD